MAFMCFRMMGRGGMRAPWGKGCQSGGEDTPLRSLGARFARGEIDRQEYEERKAALTGSSDNGR